ncbi:MAG: alpha/beta fold hydrolase, partial [Brevibacterium yomogidense]
MGDADHTDGAVRVDTHVGSPYDNKSIAARLGGETFTTDLDGLVFDGFRVPATGDAADRPVAVLVHGWPQFAACWEDTARQLAAAGIDVIAYDQRGYSPGARPEDVADYALDRLLDDLDGLRRAWGLDRFHLVGHDWGGVLGWSFAAQHPEALATFTSVSTAHPVAHATRIAEDPDQYERMHYMRRIRKDPAGVEERMLADGGAKLAALYDGAFVEDRIQSYID